MLWVAVFGFATLNTLGLLGRFGPRRSGLNFGEILAISVVSILLLGLEMLDVFHILPIRLTTPVSFVAGRGFLVCFRDACFWPSESAKNTGRRLRK
jgi:hypothetical protein